MKIYETGLAVTFEAAESGTPVIGHTFTKTSTVVIVHWLGNFASRVEQDGKLKMDFRVELHSQEAKRTTEGDAVGDCRGPRRQ